MALNDYRDEAGDFLNRIGASADSGEITPMLKEEFSLLLKALEAEDDASTQHQIYDMMFLLLEKAAAMDMDLDAEWDKGRRHKAEKYLDSKILEML